MAQDSFWVILLSILILSAFFSLILLFLMGWKYTKRENRSCLYTGLPLRHAEELSYHSKEQIVRYLFSLHQYDNPIFEFRRSAFSRETGRIFPNCVSWFNTIYLNWSFLNKRFPGHYVSWGSLSPAQQEIIKRAHKSLEGFQTENSSPTSSPRGIEQEYAYTSPGPLYVDLSSKILLGWKIIPETHFEVLIVQKPIKNY